MSDQVRERTQKFYNWRGDTSTTAVGETVGKGNYGTVYRCGDGVVVKIVPEVRKSTGATKLAYREHVMSLLQTVIVLREHTPHLPIHYGLEAIFSGPKSLSMKLYIEAFDCSLEAAPSSWIAKPTDWIALLFQVFSAIVCVAKLLDVCHNDLYPRNVLLKHNDATSFDCCYAHFGIKHSMSWHSLAALTDFGVCSSPLLASKEGPEVKRTPNVPQSEIPFGEQPPKLHVLNHTYLPQFSRDPYLIFKWGAFRTKGLNPAPVQITSWCRNVLHYIDTHQAKFCKPEATVRLLAFSFSPETLAAHKLKFPELKNQTCTHFSVNDSDRARILEDCTSLLSSVPFSP